MSDESDWTNADLVRVIVQMQKDRADLDRMRAGCGELELTELLIPENAPRVGEVMYLDTEGKEPVVVVHTSGTMVTVAPADSIRYTHQGNMYDADGRNPYVILPSRRRLPS